MSHRVSQTLCQCASLPHRPAAVGFLDEEKTQREARQWGGKMGASAFLSLRSPPPPSSLGVSRPICVLGPSLWKRPWQENLSLSLSLSRSLSFSLSLSLGWTAERTRVRGAVVCAHMGASEGERVGDGQRPRESKRRRELRPFSHVFDMGVVPTGVKEGRADWAE